MNYLKNSFYIHGFLGEADDFAPVKGLSLYDLLDLDDGEILNYLEDNFSWAKNVFAYSMGGRFVLKYYEFFKHFENVFIISAHPGLISIKELEDKINFNNLVLNKLTKKSFLNYWNSIELFRNDCKIEQLKRGVSDYKSLFEKWPLTKQINYRELIKIENNIKIVIGRLDQKYLEIYNAFLSKEKMVIIENMGHRLKPSFDLGGML